MLHSKNLEAFNKTFIQKFSVKAFLESFVDFLVFNIWNHGISYLHSSIAYEANVRLTLYGQYTKSYNTVLGNKLDKTYVNNIFQKLLYKNEVHATMDTLQEYIV